MAKKKATEKAKPSAWTAKFKTLAEKINDTKRRQCKEVHIPRIPQAKLFINGQVIILNAN
ncbi:MAG: hypothetical protein J6B49_00995 [Phascolarctobacterium sp.]|nr:hypothetical protein [Phascolarctobacterium sp.]